MALRDGLSDMLCWWRAELVGMWPARLRRKAATPVAAVLTIRRDGILVAPPDGASQVEPSLALDGESAIAQLRRRFSRTRIARRGVTVAVDSDRYLMRRLSPLRMPRSRLQAMARLDMQAATPFTLQDAYLVCGQGSAENAVTAYAVVKKSILKPLLDELAHAGIAVRELSFAEPGGGFAPDRLSFRTIVPQSRWRVFAGRLQAAGIAICLIGVAVTIAHAHWRYYRASADLDATIASAEGEAAMVRRLIAARNLKLSQIAAIRSEKQAAVPLVSILEEMSRVIPDSTWLTDIEINGNEVVFSGYSESAAALIPLLEESKLFQAPTFRTPVVRVTNQSGDRFTIAMGVETGGG